MKKGLNYIFLITSVLLVSIACTDANTDIATGMSIENPWARATFPMAKTGAAYFTLVNHSDEERYLRSASVSKDIAASVEIHETKMAEGMMQMRELSDGIKILPQSSIEFVSGGKHLMFMGLVDGFEEGERFSVTLHFADDTTEVIEFVVKDARKP